MDISVGLKVIKRQVNSLFFLSDNESRMLDLLESRIAKSVEVCWHGIENKYYSDSNGAIFNPFHSGQLSKLLYFFSREAHLESENELASKLYMLNKALNGLDLFYEVELPSVFFYDHPVGSVIGRGTFGNGFQFSQNCTVGNNKGLFPVFGENVRMMSGSKVLGQCTVGDNVIFSANSFLMDTDVPSNTIVFGCHPNCIFKTMPSSYF